LSQGSLSDASRKTPKAMSRPPAIFMTSEWEPMAKPASPAAAPRATKIMVKPITKLRE
jgi:hypothetical protein